MTISLWLAETAGKGYRHAVRAVCTVRAVGDADVRQHRFRRTRSGVSTPANSSYALARNVAFGAFE